MAYSSDLPRMLIARILVGDDCWDWNGGTNPDGYGYLTFTLNGEKIQRRAHRLVYEWLVGPIPDGLTLDHLCRNRRCVRPAHLEPVTSAENVRRGNPIWKQKAAQTHCIHGHPLSGENLYRWRDSTARRCRTCLQERALARYYRLKAESSA